MTYIPGTGTISPKPKSEVKVVQKPVVQEVFSVVNVAELKNPKKEDGFEPEADVWYMQLKYWVMMGTGLSAVFAILSIFNYRFLFLLPLGPYAAYLSWHIRKKIKKYARHLDAFS